MVNKRRQEDFIGNSLRIMTERVLMVRFLITANCCDLKRKIKRKSLRFKTIAKGMYNTIIKQNLIGTNTNGNLKSRKETIV